ncbi:ABC transporter ATP-binding protein [Bradyrhizobium sp. TM239]|uniref:ABC transporter ATP-binding protein n=1 Tax=Bradyrhizobium sp. TM239 TaxID=2599802 RepID=UPI0027D5446D|nr:ABC transporter ATP-binding protein [Bradyrhizobium sp. TM239]
MSIAIELKGVSVKLGDTVVADGVNLSIAPGEFVCLLGPSGCGKSTLLNVIAGFVQAQGTVLAGGVPITGPGKERGVVFQSSEALFPWLTVRQNVEYAARIRGVSRSERTEKADKYLRMVGLSSAANRFPSELSGGMRQRAQIARVLANEPSVILMDEPFGALDAQTREVLQIELERIWRETGASVLFVTHDIGESILLADRVVTMTVGPKARIKSIAEVDLSRPRQLASSRAIELLRTLRDDIAVEVNKVLTAQGLVLGGRA